MYYLYSSISTDVPCGHRPQKKDLQLAVPPVFLQGGFPPNPLVMTWTLVGHWAHRDSVSTLRLESFLLRVWNFRAGIWSPSLLTSLTQPSTKHELLGHGSPKLKISMWLPCAAQIYSSVTSRDALQQWSTLTKHLQIMWYSCLSLKGLRDSSPK